MLRHSHLAVLYAVVLASSALPAQVPRAGGPPAGTLGAEDRRRIDRLFKKYDRPDAPGIRHHASEHAAEQPPAAGNSLETLPQSAYASAGGTPS